MTIENERTVDWLGIEAGTGHVVLTIVDDLDWRDERRHLVRLQEKLNTYLALVESGEVFDRLQRHIGRSVARGTPIKVSILSKYALPPGASAFLEYARGNLAEAGMSLTQKVLSAVDPN